MEPGENHFPSHLTLIYKIGTIAYLFHRVITRFQYGNARVVLSTVIGTWKGLRKWQQPYWNDSVILSNPLQFHLLPSLGS